ncbi:MAG: glutamate racemase [Chitinophagales bacterium]|nr:glutamate racemase [Chitinophagales bacterium]MDW8273355.1 glutamate racemase [Chitinophagales bacterium]
MRLNKYQPIGIFDSGIGGLTVAHAITQALPNEKIIYFGDTAHLPYGDKSVRSIKQYSYIISDFLIEKECKAIVIACNSASAVSYLFLRELYKDEVHIFGVIRPVVRAVLQDDSIKKIGVIGTQATVNSGIYETLLRQVKPELQVVSLATPLLVPMIESGLADDETMDRVIKLYLDQPMFKEIDALILACTHYPLIRKKIETFLPPHVKIFDNTSFVAREVQLELERLYLLSDKQTGQHEFYVSDYTDNFQQTTRIFYPQPIKLELANIWKNN